MKIRLNSSLGINTLAGSVLLGASLLIAGAVAAPRDDRSASPKVRLDISKRKVEASTKKIVAHTKQATSQAKAKPKETFDLDLQFSKGKIEAPVKRLIKSLPNPAAPALPNRPPASNTANASPANDNPSVAPGKVRWHDDYQSALKASSKSGKPVFLFQLLGQLDKQFT